MDSKTPFAILKGNICLKIAILRGLLISSLEVDNLCIWYFTCSIYFVCLFVSASKVSEYDICRTRRSMLFRVIQWPWSQHRQGTMLMTRLVMFSCIARWRARGRPPIWGGHGSPIPEWSSPTLTSVTSSIPKDGLITMIPKPTGPQIPFQIHANYFTTYLPKFFQISISWMQHRVFRGIQQRRTRSWLLQESNICKEAYWCRRGQLRHSWFYWSHHMAKSSYQASSNVNSSNYLALISRMFSTE